MDDIRVVTGFLRNRGEVLLLRRSDKVGSYRGLWGAIAGHVESAPEPAIRREIAEETGIDPHEECSLVRAGDPFAVPDRDRGTRWLVHPFLFDCETRTVDPNYETQSYEWTTPTELLRRETVPKLWNSYDAVRPTVETVATDARHGSAYISLRALEVLRDEAALLATGSGSSGNTETVARDLLDARPSMTVVANRVHRTMNEAGPSPAVDPGAVERAAHDGIDRAITVDREAATTLAAQTDAARVGTLSRSGAVLDGLLDGEPEAVLVAESRPGREGVDVAETLAEHTDVTLTSDAAFAHQLGEWGAEMVVVGADTVFPDGAVLNKVGTRAAALAAAHEDLPFYVATSTDKIGADRAVHDEPRSAAELYDGDRKMAVANPTFDVTPAGLVDGFLTERGELATSAIDSIVREHEANARWIE